jgi:hypothetical protein
MKRKNWTNTDAHDTGRVLLLALVSCAPDSLGHPLPISMILPNRASRLRDSSGSLLLRRNLVLHPLVCGS